MCCPDHRTPVHRCAAPRWLRVAVELIGEKGHVDTRIPNADQHGRQLLIIRQRDFTRRPDVRPLHVVCRNVLPQDIRTDLIQRNQQLQINPSADQTPCLDAVERARFLDGRV